MTDRIRRNLWFAYFAGLVLWSCHSYFLLFTLMQENNLLAMRLDGRPYTSDFVNVYNAGVLGRKGAAVNIYDANLQASLAEKVVAPVVPEIPFYLQAPPNFFVLCIPLSYFSPHIAWIVYCALGLALNLLAMGFLAWKYFNDSFSRAFVLVSTFASFPTWIGVRLGNSSLYLLPPLVLFWWLLKQKRYFAAGLATGLLLVKVQYLPFIGLIGLSIGGLRYLAGAVASGLVVVGLTTAVLGWDNVIEWPRVILHAEGSSAYSGVSADKMQNLRGMIAVLTQHIDLPASRTAASVMCLVSAIGLAWCWRKPFRELAARSTFGFEVCAALSTILMLIFSIHTHFQDYILMLIASLWIYVAAKRDDLVPETKRRWLCALAISFPGVSWALFILSQLPFLPFQPLSTFAVFVVGCVISTWFTRPRES